VLEIVLERIGQRRALVTFCIGYGMGIATITDVQEGSSLTKIACLWGVPSRPWCPSRWSSPSSHVLRGTGEGAALTF
jgi:hypothetical protein